MTEDERYVTLEGPKKIEFLDGIYKVRLRQYLNPNVIELKVVSDNPDLNEYGYTFAFDKYGDLMLGFVKDKDDRYRGILSLDDGMNDFMNLFPRHFNKLASVLLPQNAKKISCLFGDQPEDLEKRLETNGDKKLYPVPNWRLNTANNFTYDEINGLTIHDNDSVDKDKVTKAAYNYLFI